MRGVFSPYAGGTPAAMTGYKIGGTDVALIFMKSAGGDQAPFNTGYKTGGVDFRYLFRYSGFVPPPPPTLTPTPTPTPNVVVPTDTPTPTPTPGAGTGAALTTQFIDSFGSTAFFKFSSADSDTHASVDGGASYYVLETWQTGGGTLADYDVRVTVTSGFSFSTTAGSGWIQLGASSPTWGRSATISIRSTTFTVEIRDHNTLTVLATSTGNIITCDNS